MMKKIYEDNKNTLEVIKKNYCLNKKLVLLDLFFKKRGGGGQSKTIHFYRFFFFFMCAPHT